MILTVKLCVSYFTLRKEDSVININEQAVIVLTKVTNNILLHWPGIIITVEYQKVVQRFHNCVKSMLKSDP